MSSAVRSSVLLAADDLGRAKRENVDSRFGVTRAFFALIGFTGLLVTVVSSITLTTLSSVRTIVRLGENRER